MDEQNRSTFITYSHSAFVALQRVASARIILAGGEYDRPAAIFRGAGTTKLLQSIRASKAFLSAGAVQCGFCTPGMIMAAWGLLMKKPEPTAEEVKEALCGNLCRCTGYSRIIEAVLDAAERMRNLPRGGPGGRAPAGVGRGQDT